VYETLSIFVFEKKEKKSRVLDLDCGGQMYDFFSSIMLSFNSIELHGRCRNQCQTLKRPNEVLNNSEKKISK